MFEGASLAESDFFLKICCYPGNCNKYGSINNYREGRKLRYVEAVLNGMIAKASV